MWSIAVILMVLIYIYEKKTYKSLYTPTILLGLPTIIIMLLCSSTRFYTHFITLTSASYGITILGILFFWIGGNIFKAISGITFVEGKERIIGNGTRYFILISTIVCVCIMLINLRSILNGRHFYQIDDQEYAQNGVIAHIGNFVGFLLIIFLINLKINILKISRIILACFICVCFIIKLLTAIKGQIILPFIVAGVYLGIRGKLNINIKSISFTLINVFLLFTIPSLLFNISDDHTSIEFAIQYFLFYLFAGVLGLSAWTLSGLGFNNTNIDFIFGFFINVYKKLLGITGISNQYSVGDFLLVTETSATWGHKSNVFTLIGEVYLNIGYWIGSIFFLLLGFFSYWLYSKRGKNFFLSLCYSYVGGCLVLNFFAQFIFKPTFYMVLTITPLLYIISKSKKIIT